MNVFKKCKACGEYGPDMINQHGVRIHYSCLGLYWSQVTKEVKSNE